MDFALSPEQEELGQAARGLLDRFADPAEVRAHIDTNGAYDPKLWSAMVEQGWLGIALPEEVGGVGLGWVEAAVLLEQIGRHNAPAPFLPTVVALASLYDARDSSAAAEWIAPIVRGEAVAAAVWSRDGGAVTAAAAGRDRWVLTGRADPTEAAAAADVAVVAAREGLFLVDLERAGRPAPQPAMDRTRSLAWPRFDATPAVRLGGPDAADRFLERGAVAASAELLGGAARVLELATEYARDRVQFGQPIGSFQAVKHRCADMLVDVEGMRSAVWYAAWCLDGATPPEAAIAASTAKVWCAPAAARVMASGLQVHGGIGFTWEHDMHLFIKRSQFAQGLFGDADYHRTRLAAMLRDKVRAGEGVI